MPVPSPSSSPPPSASYPPRPASPRASPSAGTTSHPPAGARALRPAVAGVPADATASIPPPMERMKMKAPPASSSRPSRPPTAPTSPSSPSPPTSPRPARHHLACALATLLEDHQVHDVLLLAALNVPTSNTLRDGAVYQVTMNGASRTSNPFPPPRPLADRFLASLLAFLGTTDARVRVLATPGKRTRRNGRIIPGVEDPDACIPVLVDAAERALGVKLSTKAAVAEPVPPEEFQQDVGHGKGGHGRGAGRESGGNLLMYR
ncbi:hypothetical protein DFJ73DRAFT_785784 [Zopfochytrium polystomum]|nr:hypothetical protein DFJ73DRAFT_785784 [Zopfochytrium polystomum]